jgi:NADP-dependent 3-hydroxy acid dehydrogenase YdfG
MVKTWLITGCSTGFGRILVEELLKKRENVVATARNIENIRDLESLGAKITTLDVTKGSDCHSATQFAFEQFGRIDVLVNNAGYGTIGAIEEVSDSEVRTMFDVNVFGLLNMLREALPAMRAQKYGRILNLSSLAGSVAYPGSSTYAATKHAVEAINEGLNKELGHLNIRAIAVAPGPFRTDFAGRSLVLAEKEIEDYAETAGKRRVSIRENDGKQVGDPLKAVLAMVKAAEMEHPPVRLPMGEMAFSEIESQLARRTSELLEFESLGRPTDFE